MYNTKKGLSMSNYISRKINFLSATFFNIINSFQDIRVHTSFKMGQWGPYVRVYT